ncbi:hypothetical protein GCM10010403_32720 [Glycomyces rutgersensis]|uniref:Uncharacterized protein n=1 Tax=Glycomyces rutgersensis TaxID=58115 RepID=A0ABN3FUC6_9ACTN
MLPVAHATGHPVEGDADGDSLCHRDVLQTLPNMAAEALAGAPGECTARGLRRGLGKRFLIFLNYTSNDTYVKAVS